MEAVCLLFSGTLAACCFSLSATKPRIQADADEVLEEAKESLLESALFFPFPFLIFKDFTFVCLSTTSVSHIPGCQKRVQL